MDCVYDSYREYMEFLGENAAHWEHMKFRFLRRTMQGGDGPTDGSIAPWLIQNLARRKGLSVIAQTGYDMTPGHWAKNAPGKLAAAASSRVRWWTVDKTFIQPAIYLMWGMQHAVFSPSVPTYGVPVIGIHIYREERDGQDN